MNVLYNPFQPALSSSALKLLGISLQYFKSCDSLKNIIHSYLEICVTRPISYPVIPDGTQAVFISPDGSMIGGAQSKANDIEILKEGKYFGIRFFPGAIRHFFDLNLAEITDQYVNSGYFPCKAFQHIHSEIFECCNFEDKVHICENWLLNIFKPVSVSPFDHALLCIYQSLGNIKINQLAKLVGWSSRHLNRLFRYHTGLSTKMFVQVIRIQYVYKQLSRRLLKSSEIAIDLGFCDQAHMLNEYKKRLLSTPGSFIERFVSDFYNT